MDVSQQVAEPKIQQNTRKHIENYLFKDTESTFRELLQKDCAVTIHPKNLEKLMTEMYKTRNDLNPSFMLENFQ